MLRTSSVVSPAGMSLKISYCLSTSAQHPTVRQRSSGLLLSRARPLYPTSGKRQFMNPLPTIIKQVSHPHFQRSRQSRRITRSTRSARNILKLMCYRTFVGNHRSTSYCPSRRSTTQPSSQVDRISYYSLVVVLCGLKNMIIL